MPTSPEAPKRGLARIVGAGFIAAAIAAALVIAIVRPFASHDSASAPGPEFVTRDGDQLMLNGEQFRYAATNTYELMFGQPVTVDAYLTRMNDAGFNVLRTWAFFDIGKLDGTMGVEISNKGTWFQYFDPEQGRPVYNDGENGLVKLDYVIYSASQHDIKLILPLVNNWANFGGLDQYVTWADGLWHDDFMTDEQIKTWYKEWVAHVLNRVNTYSGIAYKDDPTIMAWELANEMRCSESGPYLSSAACRSSTIVAWADEMSTYIRSIDSKHLISFGSEGFLCDTDGGAYWLTNCSESGDPVAITALPNIDMHGIHIYPDHWTPEEPTDDWVDWSVWWIERHADIANDAGKPYYIGEYGWRDQSTRLPVFNEWLTAFYDAGGDGSNFWMMQPTNPGLTPPDNDGFVVYCPSTVCTLIGNWNKHVQDGTDWNEFGPLGDTDVVTTSPGVPVTFSIVDNDLAFGDATLDVSTIDLDLATPGRQDTLELERGTYTLEGGSLTFVPAAGVTTGSARLEYTITDSRGRSTDPIAVSVVVVERSS